MKFPQKEIFRKFVPLSLALIMLAAFAVGGTRAYMLAKSDQKTNTFTKGDADIEVSEPGDGTYTIDSSNTVAKEVYVTNDKKTTPNAIPVYVRVRLVPVVIDSDGNGTGDPVSVTYPNLNISKWQAVGEYYYYKGILQPGATTEDLIKSATIAAGIPSGKKVEIQVIADSIQIVGAASKEAWGLVYSGGTWKSA
nr:hypothetical protein [uncultured Caproiciproducens sp.]